MANEKNKRRGRGGKGSSQSAALPLDPPEAPQAPDEVTSPGAPSPFAGLSSEDKTDPRAAFSATDEEVSHTKPFAQPPAPLVAVESTPPPSEETKPLPDHHTTEMAPVEVVASLGNKSSSSRARKSDEEVSVTRNVGGLAARVADAAAAQLLIFDNLPDDEKPRADDRVLLLGLIWGGETLVELEQVSKGGDLKAGRLFDLPASNLPQNFKIVQHVGDELVLSIPAELASEVHHTNGRKTDSLEQLSVLGKARRIDAPFRGYAYTVQSDDRIVVKLGAQLTLIARYVRAARQPDKGILDMVDVPFATMLIIALMAMGLFWLMLLITPRFDDTFGDDLSRNQARFTQYQVKPEELKPKFKELSGAKEGAKAKGDEGKFGKKDEKKKEADPSKKGAPLVDPDKKEKDRQTVMKSGLLAALSKLNTGQESAASDVLGPGGLGTGINNALGGTKGGAGQGDAYGVGGLGSRGNGGGGGGNALGIGGLGTKGTGHGKGGFGLDLGGHGKDDTEFVPGKTTIVGGLSREVINRVIQRHYNEIKYCYEKELTHDPGLYGKVVVLFDISPNGTVGDALVQQTTMSSEPVESCILNHVKRWIFPAAQGSTQVTYPYVFKASGQ